MFWNRINNVHVHNHDSAASSEFPSLRSSDMWRDIDSFLAPLTVPSGC